MCDSHSPKYVEQELLLIIPDSLNGCFQFDKSRGVTVTKESQL
jgi:hypothetical protein